jgi:hypothetical protein
MGRGEDWRLSTFERAAGGASRSRRCRNPMLNRSGHRGRGRNSRIIMIKTRSRDRGPSCCKMFMEAITVAHEWILEAAVAVAHHWFMRPREVRFMIQTLCSGDLCSSKMFKLQGRGRSTALAKSTHIITLKPR